ncbi:MAG: cation:proton antiporter [Alphaproteobacteria bacterium]|nr:cation:proton antiporter [Alphaproteobacteria bacterium]
MLHAETQLLILLLIAALVGMGARRFQLPYTVALVLSGIALGFLHLEELSVLHLSPDLLMAVFLPALLFEAAYHVDFAKFRKLAGPVLLLAFPGVLVAVTLTALGAYGALQALGVADFSLGLAFLFASMIAATDPISVLALFKSLGVEKKLYLLVEGESLLNDGVAVVVFIIVAAVLGIETGHGHAPHLETVSEIAVYGVRTFGWMAVGGAFIGALVGAVVSVLTRQVDDKLIETSLTVVVAYGSFLLAEHFHASGVLSCVAAGMVLGSFGSRFGMSVRTRIAVVDFWEFMAFFSNTFVFLLVGLELDIPELLGASGLIAATFVVVVVARAIVVYGSLPLTRFTGGALRGKGLPTKWAHVMVWGGLRGSLSMVLVMGLPVDMPGRRLLLVLVFGVVSVSLLLQAMTMKPLLQRLGLTRQRQVRLAYEQARGRAWMAQAALRDLDRQAQRLDPALHARFRPHFERALQQAQAAAATAAGDHLDEERLHETALHLITIQEDALRKAVDERVVSPEAAEELLTGLAEERERLVHEGVGEDIEPSPGPEPAPPAEPPATA